MMSNPKHRQKMALAFFAMCNGFNKGSKHATSRWFLLARGEANAVKSEIQLGIPKSEQAMQIAQQKSYVASRSYLSKLNTEPRSAEHCKSISQSKQGKPAAWLSRPNADIIKCKISLSNTGKVFSDLHKQNLSKSHKGIIPPNKGKKMSEEQREILRKPKTEEHKQAMRKPKTRGCCIFCKKETSIGLLKRHHLKCGY